MWQLFINSRVWTVPAFISRFTGLCIFWPFGDKHTDKEGPQEKKYLTNIMKCLDMPKSWCQWNIEKMFNRWSPFFKNHRRELLDEMLPRLLWTNWMLMLSFWKANVDWPDSRDHVTCSSFECPKRLTVLGLQACFVLLPPAGERGRRSPELNNSGLRCLI